MSTLVHVIIPKGCHRPSVEITYDLADAIERITVIQCKKRSFPNKYIPMEENEDGSLRVMFTTGGKTSTSESTSKSTSKSIDLDVIAATIDTVLHTFVTSRWQNDTEKIAAMYDPRRLKRIVNKKSRKTIRYEYRAIADDSY